MTSAPSAFLPIFEQASLKFAQFVMGLPFRQPARTHGGMNFPLHGMELLMFLPLFMFGVVTLMLMPVSPLMLVALALAFSTSVFVKGTNLVVGLLLAQLARPQSLVYLPRRRMNPFPPGVLGIDQLAVSTEQIPAHLAQLAFRMFLAQLPRLYGGPQFPLHGTQLFTFGVFLTLTSLVSALFLAGMVPVLFTVSVLPPLFLSSVFVNCPQFSTGLFLAQFPHLNGGPKFPLGGLQELPFNMFGVVALMLVAPVTMGVLALALMFIMLTMLPRLFVFFFRWYLSPAFIFRLRRGKEGAARQQEGECKGYGLSGLHNYFLRGFVVGNVFEQSDERAPIVNASEASGLFPSERPKA